MYYSIIILVVLVTVRGLGWIQVMSHQIRAENVGTMIPIPMGVGESLD